MVAGPGCVGVAVAAGAAEALSKSMLCECPALDTERTNCAERQCLQSHRCGV